MYFTCVLLAAPHCCVQLAPPSRCKVHVLHLLASDHLMFMAPSCSVHSSWFPHRSLESLFHIVSFLASGPYWILDCCLVCSEFAHLDWSSAFSVSFASSLHIELYSSLLLWPTSVPIPLVSSVPWNCIWLWHVLKVFMYQREQTLFRSIQSFNPKTVIQT